MKLRTHLVALVLVAVVPIVLFATVVVVLLWQTDRRGTEERLRNTARALALAVDREVVSAVSSLEILASSRRLDQGDVAGFYAEARRALDTQRRHGWATIVLTSPAGEPLMDTARPLGGALPRTLTPAEVAEVAAAGRESASGLLVGTALGQPVVSVRVPVKRQGTTRYVMAAVIEPQAFVSLLRQQNVPADWLSSVFDRRGLTIARTVAP